MRISQNRPSDCTVAQFAKLTGDLHVLSSVDQRVLALAWMLEKESGEVSRLRTTPLPRTPAGGRQRIASQEPNARGLQRLSESSGGGGDETFPAFIESSFTSKVEYEAARASAATESTRKNSPAEPPPSDLMASLGLASNEAMAGAHNQEGDEGEDIEDVLDDTPCLVAEGVYLGSLDAACNFAALRERGVTHILTVAKELSQEFTPEWHHLQ